MTQGKVFVVDDDHHVLASVDALLRGRGYSVECFTNGLTFLERVDLDQVGCVISDLQMPEMHGTELQKRLVQANSPLSLIIVTGYADVPSTVKVMETGAVTLLEKPYDTQSLTSAIVRALAQSEQAFKYRRKLEDAIARFARLDEEEIQVMECTIKGMPIKGISEHLTMSNRTVDRRRQSALVKAGVSTVAEFAILLEMVRREGKS